MDIKDSVGAKFFAAQDRLRGGPDPDLVTADYVANLVGFPPLDLAGHTGFAAGFYAAFPDLCHTIEEVVFDGKTEALRFTIHGTHQGEFMGIPATGKAVTIPCMVFITIHDGRVAEARGMFDRMGLMQQLGVVPAQ